MNLTRVLAIFANPKGSSSLRIGEEDRVIHECVKRSMHRDNIALDIHHAATVHDLRRALLENEYSIVHFSGHGSEQGLAFEDELGNVQVVPIYALAELLSDYSPPIETVILNACYSDSQGKLVSLGVPYTICMEAPISDKGAIEFARGFYDAIGAGKDIEFAFNEGCRTIKLSGLPDGLVPVCYKKIMPTGLGDNTSDIELLKEHTDSTRNMNYDNSSLDQLFTDQQLSSKEVRQVTYDWYYHAAIFVLEGILEILERGEIIIKAESLEHSYQIHAYMDNRNAYEAFVGLEKGARIKISGKFSSTAFPWPWKYVIFLKNAVLVEGQM